jgi:ATP-binding cassette subfamily B protein
VPAAGIGITLLVIAVCFALTQLSRIAVRRWERARNQQADLFGFIGDALGARNDLLPLGESAWATARIRDDLAVLYRTEGRAYIGGRAFWPLTQLFVALAFGLGVGFALQRLDHGAISIGALTAIYLYIDLLQKPLEEMSSQAGQLQQMMAVLAIVARTLDPGGTPELTGTDPPAPLPDGPLAVSFEDVTFGYGDEPVLHEVSFAVGAGRSLGIVGRTGAGKSTIVNLLCGLARPHSGWVRIGGVDASELSAVDFARRVTVMSQRAHVFGASVRDNVTLFDGAVPDERVWEVLERLNAADWVRALPDGVDTRIGVGGRTLSEGELQLLAGVRALIRPYSLLVVDEGMSRLDPETEQSWAALLDTVMRDRTVVIIEHRWGMLRSVDEVLVMDDGRVTDLLPGPAAVRAQEVAR